MNKQVKTAAFVREFTTENGIKVEKHYKPVVCTEVREHSFKKDVVQCILKQEITTISHYPSSRPVSSASDSLFALEDYGISTEPLSNTSVRVFFYAAPLGTTVEKMNEILGKHPEATIVQVIGNHPMNVLTPEQIASMDVYGNTIDSFANSLVIRFSKNDEKNPGGLILRDGKPQYRNFLFKVKFEEDKDFRTDDESYYASPEIQAEMDMAISHAAQNL